MGGYTEPFGRFWEVIPYKLGVNGESVNATVTSNVFSTAGYQHMTVEVDYTYSAGTALTMYIETTNDASATTPTYRRVMSSSTAAGTSTLTPRLWSRTVGAADAGINVNLDIAVDGARVVFAMTGGPDASDVITARVRLSA
jgi:hypothetical protein